jgi:hypothetical protein
VYLYVRLSGHCKLKIAYNKSEAVCGSGDKSARVEQLNCAFLSLYIRLFEETPKQQIWILALNQKLKFHRSQRTRITTTNQSYCMLSFNLNDKYISGADSLIIYTVSVNFVMLVKKKRYIFFLVFRLERKWRWKTTTTTNVHLLIKLAFLCVSLRLSFELESINIAHWKLDFPPPRESAIHNWNVATVFFVIVSVCFFFVVDVVVVATLLYSLLIRLFITYLFSLFVCLFIKKKRLGSG